MKILIIAVLLIVIGAVGYWIYQSKPGQPAVNQQSTTPRPETPAEKGNFSKTGNLSVQEDGLLLVWGEPGNPAANVKLRFTQQSTCILDGEKKDCTSIDKGQEYGYVGIEGNMTDGEVVVTKLEQVEAPQ